MRTHAIFIGSKKLGLEMLKVLHGVEPASISAVITVDDRTDDRSSFDEISAYAVAVGLELFVCTNKAEAKDVILRFKPDLCFVCGWYWLFDADTLAAAKGGFIGVHHSPLPRYRGGSPLVWQIINGEDKAGTTVFYMGEGMDDGDIIAQFTTPIGSQDHIADVAVRLEGLLVAAMPVLWRNLLDGTTTRTVQNHAHAISVPQRKPDDGLIDWTWKANRVFDFIRAQSPPYPGAFTIIGVERVHCLDGKVLDGLYDACPGEVLFENGENSIISCGEGTAIEITQVSINNKVYSPKRALGAKVT